MAITDHSRALLNMTAAGTGLVGKTDREKVKAETTPLARLPDLPARKQS